MNRQKAKGHKSAYNSFYPIPLASKNPFHLVGWGGSGEKIDFRFQIITIRVRSTTGGYIFSLFIYSHPGGTQSPPHDSSTGPTSFLWGTPVTRARSLPGGIPVPGGWYLSPRWRNPSPRWGYPKMSGWGTPLSQD